MTMLIARHDSRTVCACGAILPLPLLGDAEGNWRCTSCNTSHPALPVDEHGVITIGEVGSDTVQVMPMIYNDRIVIGPTECVTSGYAHGWCYDKGLALWAALLAWDPYTEAEPPGYKKRATRGIRRAPRQLAPPVSTGQGES